MNLIKRPRLIYLVLLLVSCMIAVWQYLEHERVVRSLRTALINRSRDITSTLGLVIRSQRRFWGVILEDRIEEALKELARSGELNSVALLNARGEVVVSAGAKLSTNATNISQAGVRWEPGLVTVVNLIDLGAVETAGGETNSPTIILPPRPEGEEGRPGPPRFRDRDRDRDDNENDDWDRDRNRDRDRDRDDRRDRNRDDERGDGVFGPPPPDDREDGGWRTRRRAFRRPFWMDESEYTDLLRQRGLHGIVITMPTASFEMACAQDLAIRWAIGGLGVLSALGLGLAWRNLSKSSDLQMRLLRASEMNAHLREMNLAAAGLAHETRNPLNIIRGLAQMISRQSEASSETRTKSEDIIHETDRVTAQLNEFINYSRPRDVRRTSVSLASLVGEVRRALTYDLEEKQLTLITPDLDLSVEADEQLFRQVLFNLLLNAIQAADVSGTIELRVSQGEGTEVTIEVADNGSGVLPEHRDQLFKPYFTTHDKGTGLGLAVVQQIVLAHGWEIEFAANQPRGAIFRLHHVKVAGDHPFRSGASKLKSKIKAKTKNGGPNKSDTDHAD